MIYLLIVSLIWAFSFGIIKDGLTGIDSNFIAFARLFLSLLIFAPLIRLRGVSRKDMARLFVIGILQYGVMYLTYIYSFQFLKAYEVALFTILTPLYVTLTNNFLHKRSHWVTLFTTILAIAGAAVVKMVQPSSSGLLFGFLILQISNFCFALGQVYYKEVMRRLPSVKDEHIFGILYLGGASITAIYTLLFTDLSNLSLNSNQILSLVYLGVVASGVGFFFWNYGARRVNTGALAIFNNLKIPLAITVSLIFFQESASLPELILGGGLIVIALAINEWADNHRQIQTGNAQS